MELPLSHPVKVEERCRASLVHEEGLLRRCIDATLQQRLEGLKFRPHAPSQLFVSHESLNLSRHSSSMGSFCNTPTTTSLSPAKSDNELQRNRIAESQKKAMLDTGDIDAYLKQLQRKHSEEYRRLHSFAKVHYQRSRSETIKHNLFRLMHEEEERRNDIEIVETLMLQKAFENHAGCRLTKIMLVQLEEGASRSKLFVEEIERMQELMVLFRSADLALEVLKYADVSSPSRGRPVTEASTMTPQRPASFYDLRSAASSARLRRRASQAVDDAWISTYLNSEATKLRTDLESEREAVVERLEAGMSAERDAIARGDLVFSSVVGGLHLNDNVPENRRRAYVRPMLLVVEDEEVLARYQVDLLHEQALARMRLRLRSSMAKAAGEPVNDTLIWQLSSPCSP